MLRSNEPDDGGTSHGRTGGNDVAVQTDAAEFWCDLSSEPGPRGEIAVLRVAGDIDLRSMPMFAAALAAATSRPAAALVVDMTGVGFCSARGFALLIAAARQGRAGNVDHVVCGLSPAVDRIASLLQPEPVLVRYGGAGAALTALRADRSPEGSCVRCRPNHLPDATEDYDGDRRPYAEPWAQSTAEHFSIGPPVNPGGSVTRSSTHVAGGRDG